MSNIHKSVLLQQVLHYLESCKGGVFIDCTLGEGGHTKAIIEKVKPAMVLGLDADAGILELARGGLPVGPDIRLVNSNFTRLKDVMGQAGISHADAILIDLGISMYHYRASGRGFSFDKEEPLDMRVDVSNPLSADVVINEYPEERLKKIFWAYGEERFSGLIARNIVRTRGVKRIGSSKELAELIRESVPKKFHERIHPATRIFQAVRIEVNSELENLESIIQTASQALKPGGRLAIITFHSLEDRIVKHKFLELSDAPVIDDLRGTRAPQVFKVLTKKPLVADESEVSENAASRSAKLRVLERVSG